MYELSTSFFLSACYSIYYLFIKSYWPGKKPLLCKDRRSKSRCCSVRMTVDTRQFKDFFYLSVVVSGVFLGDIVTPSICSIVICIDNVKIAALFKILQEIPRLVIWGSRIGIWNLVGCFPLPGILEKQLLLSWNLLRT